MIFTSSDAHILKFKNKLLYSYEVFKGKIETSIRFLLTKRNQLYSF